MASLSRSSRPIGPTYNDTNRAARKLKRQGFAGAADKLALQGAAEQLAGGGGNITSSEGNMAEREKRENVQSGIMRGRMAVLDGGSAEGGSAEGGSAEGGAGGEEPTVAAKGSQLTARLGLYERMRGGITPEMKTEARGLGITESGFAKGAALAEKNPLTTSTPASEAPTSPAAPGAPGAPAWLRRGSYIDGVPAPDAIAAATASATPPRFGASLATDNIKKLGLAGAIEDYRKRADGAAPPSEPGNMAELNARDAVGPPSALASGPVGPLQKALLDARAGREARVVQEAADAKGAAAITSGMQASAAPRLDTSSFRRRLGGTAAAPTPATSTRPAPTAPTLSRPAPTAPTLSRPAPTLSNTESTRSRDIRRKAEGEESLAKRRKVISDARKAKADKIPSPFPSLGDDSGINRIFRSIVASNTK